jgi:KaiC/GvpD/RAD55 family RecA-like ATPase
MKLKTATRKKDNIKMALLGPSGSHKTYSALQIAYGLCSDWSKIAVVDTENSSAYLYANFGTYNILGLYVPLSRRIL